MPKVLKDYLFEFAKYCYNKAKQALKTVIKIETPPLLAFPIALQLPQLCHQLPSKADSYTTLSSPLIHPTALATLTEYPLLDSYTIYIIQDDNKKTYNNTIDICLKLNIKGKRLKDYNFVTFKGVLVRAFIP